MKRAVVLLSGGLDSATLLYFAKKKGFKCFCLVFDYGQRHRKEIESAKEIARAAHCPYQVIKLNLPWKGSSLLDRNISIPQQANRQTGKQANIPSTYVPARNIIFLSFALSYAEAVGAKAIFIGAHAQDYSVGIGAKVIKKGDGLIFIEKIKPGDYIACLDKKTLKIKWGKVKGLSRHPYVTQQMYRIVTEHGRSLEVSGGHSLFFLNESGEIESVKVEDIKRGNFILAPSKLKMFGNLKEINLLDLLNGKEFIFVTHPKLGDLIKSYSNEKERWWKRANVMPLKIYNQFYRNKSKIKDKEIFIKGRKDKKKSTIAVVKLNKEFCFFLGLWLADGSYGKGSTICISCADPEALRNLRIVCRFFKAKIYVSKNKVDRFIFSIILAKLMSKLGFGGRAKTKIIPPMVYDLPLRLQSAFIRGFIIGDGSIQKDGSISIDSTNELLINGMQDLLLNFGIIAYKNKQFYKKTNFSDKPFFIYSLTIANNIDKRIFIEQIGNINNKITISPSSRSKIRGIPTYRTLNDDLKSFSSRVDVTKTKNSIRNNAIYTNNRFDRKLLRRLVRYVPHKTLKEKWDRLVNNDLIFAQIKQKRRVHYNREFIYDVSIKRDENFICNGVVAHNSGYPDCRPAFYHAFKRMLDVGTKVGAEGKGIKILTPLINKNKAGIIRMGLRLGVLFKLTWSCYKGGVKPCGECDSCYFRAKGFREAGIKDPLY